MAPSRRAFLRGAVGIIAATSISPAHATLLRGLGFSGSGSVLNIANRAALDTAIANWPATGNMTWVLAAGDYGSLGIYGKDFSSAPVVLTGQSDPSLVTVSFLGLASTSGFTFSKFTVNGAVTPSIQIDDFGTPVTLTFNSVVTTGGTPQGSVNGGGWLIYCQTNIASRIVINGQNDASKPDVFGRNEGIRIVGTVIGGGSLVINDMTISNSGPDGIIGAGAQNTTINHCLINNVIWGGADHPDGLQFFANGSVPTTDLVLTNNGIDWGTYGLGSQGIFLEDVNGVTIQYNWIRCGEFNNATSMARGSGALIDSNFAQGFVTPAGGGTIISRGGTVNNIVTNNTAQTVQNYAADGVNPGYVPAVLPGSNVIISAATDKNDYTALNTWRISHPTSRSPT